VRQGAAEPGRPWQVYLLRCEDGTLYTGISPDPAKRFAAHASGKGAAYTKMHKPQALLACEVIGGYGAALRREAQLKRQPKLRKLAWAQDPAGLPRPAEGADWLNRKVPKKKRRRARA
jgi:putative endonuclease